jgi:myo-inositol-1(or 4)-monophosphatase
MDTRPDEPRQRCWIVDPIDGTQNFVRGLYPAFGISMAFAVGGHVEAGGVSLPIQDDLFLAERGAGAFRNGKLTQVSDTTSVEQAWIEVDLGGAADRKPIIDVTARLMDVAGAVRCRCACVVGMCSVAAGELDGYVHYGLNPWDFAAAKLIVEEAGGKVTDFSGAPVSLFGPHHGFVASNGAFHDEFLATLDA